MDAQEFITKKYEHNNWGFYPPSRRLVGEWLEEFAKEYHAEQLRLGDVVRQSEHLKAFAQLLYEKEYLVRRSVDEALKEFENL